MCGIAGILSLNTSLIPSQRLKQMTDSIAHRGPDGEGIWINAANQVGLGNRRLAIIDLSEAASQPMHYLKRYTITYNGEIYNYREIREQLIVKGYSFTSSGDTEVVLAAYDCYKENCLQYFDGMFAFAIWDEQEQIFFAARDRFGEKPFYYFKDEEQFVFASEMKALFAAGIERTINDNMLLNYLAIGQTPNPNDLSKTFFENIHALPASHFLNFNTHHSEIFINRYYDLDKEKQVMISENEASEKFSHLFSLSVNHRLRSDVSIGTSLSGGLDSSSVVSAITKSAPDLKPFTFSAIFPGFEKDESIYINKVTSKFNLQNFPVTPSAEDFINDFENLCYVQEEPFQSSSIYAQYKVYELASKKGVKVILDGQGADEILAGYHKHYHWFWQQLIKNPLQQKSFKNEFNKTKNLNIEISWNWRNYFAAWLPFAAAEQLRARTLNSIRSKSFLNKDFLNHAYDKFSVYKPVVRKLNDILYHNTMDLGLGELLRYADKNSMAHGVEVRLPFLNQKLVEFIFSLPSDYKIRNGFTKWILRRSVEDDLPDEITWRTDKTGYEPPQKKWMENKKVQDYIHAAKEKLVHEKILKKNVLSTPVKPNAAHNPDNFDWRFLCAAAYL